MDRTDNNPFPKSLVTPLLSSISSLLNGTRQPLWDVAAQTLGAILGRKQFRDAVWAEEQCISGLVKALKINPNPQAQYWCLSSLWMLSFEKEPAEGMDQ